MTGERDPERGEGVGREDRRFAGEPTAAMRLRPEPPRVTRLSRRVLVGLGLVAGLGVGATRFAADVMLDLLDGADTERTRLEMVRRKPIPFPPEPVASIGVALTRRSLDQADHRGGRRNLWLRTLDRAGLGFDS